VYDSEATTVKAWHFVTVEIKVGWPTLKVPDIMVWGYKFSTVTLLIFKERFL